jgi:hypothetical protein
MYGTSKPSHKFWGNHKARTMITRSRFEIHDVEHRQACFKTSCECRALHPKPPHITTEIDLDPTSETSKWFRLVEGDRLVTTPWLLNLKRPMGCEYINQHNPVISEVFNCNSNVQIGDPSHVFYSTLYSSKNTQAEDADRAKRVTVAIIRRLVRYDRLVRAGMLDRVPTGFPEGISRLLSAITATTSRDVVSAPMAHLLICQEGKRFQYSHEFAPLLVNQIDDTLAGRNTDSILRRTRKRGRKADGGGKQIMWLDCLSNDYLYRPHRPQFKNMSIYEFTMNYEKHVKNWKQYNPDEIFAVGHPGLMYSTCIKRDQCAIPRVYFNKGSLCSIEDLDMHNQHPAGHTVQAREQYAKIALLLFYPFRSAYDLKINDSHWDLFMRELSKKRQGRMTKFWDYGFTILQNMNDRKTVQKQGTRPMDEITRVTKMDETYGSGSRKRKRGDDGVIDISEIVDPLEDM